MTTGRRIFVGDIQGCTDELKRLIDRLRLDPAHDQLFSVGDVINRGPQSAEAIRTLRAVDGRAVLGNHEVHFLSAGARPFPPDIEAAPDREELVAWLRQLPVMVVLPDIVLVHAGWSPRWPVDQAQALAERLGRAAADPVQLRDDADVRFAVDVRYCDPDGNIARPDWPPPPPPFAPWYAFYRGSRTVVFGHWARRGLVVEPRLRGLDTGCVYGKELTAWIAEEDRFVQVPAARAYRAV